MNASRQVGAVQVFVEHIGIRYASWLPGRLLASVMPQTVRGGPILWHGSPDWTAQADRGPGAVANRTSCGPLGRERAGLPADRIRFRPVSDQCQTSAACRICGVHVTVSCRKQHSPCHHVRSAESHVGFAECHFGCTGVLTEIDEGN